MHYTLYITTIKFYKNKKFLIFNYFMFFTYTCRWFYCYVYIFVIFFLLQCYCYYAIVAIEIIVNSFNSFNVVKYFNN